MKNRIRSFILAFSIFFPLLLIAQPSPNSNGPGGGTNGLPAGGANGSVPVGGGMGLMVLMAVALCVNRQISHPDKE